MNMNETFYEWLVDCNIEIPAEEHVDFDEQIQGPVPTTEALDDINTYLPAN